MISLLEALRDKTKQESTLRHCAVRLQFRGIDGHSLIFIQHEAVVKSVDHGSYLSRISGASRRRYYCLGSRISAPFSATQRNGSTVTAILGCFRAGPRVSRVPVDKTRAT